MPQLIERMQHLAFPLNTANLNPVEGLTVKVDLDTPFLLRGVVIWNLNVPAGQGVDGQIAIRFAKPNGTLVQRQLTSSNLVAPGNQYNSSGLAPNKALAAPIRPGVLYPAGSVISMDVQGLPAGIAVPTGAIIVFIGTNLYREGQIWAPGYPAKWDALPYLDNLTVQSVPVPGGFPLLSIPFTAQADSDFVFQAGVYTDSSLSGSPSSLLVANDAFEELFFRLTAVTPGVGGNAISFEVIDTGVPNTAFNLSIVGPTITVTASIDSFGTTMLLETLIANLQASPPFNALVTIGPPIGGLLSSVGGFPKAFLFGGTGAGPAAVDQLVDLGVIIRDPAYKAYSNDYIPVALLFPFLGAQNPGWLYPEIYVPRLSQLYFDFNYLYPGFTPASPITITLGLKGMKVYPQ